MNLKEIRLQKSLTQEETAKILGVTRRTYINYESGKINEDSLKYKFIVDTLKKANQIDEEHGILTVEQIKTICNDIFKDYQIEYCYLFGSYAKNKATEKSDIDLLIKIPIDGMKYFELLELLREKLSKRIDLLTSTQLNNNDSLIDEILKYGIRIY
ncbi:MAG: nucleotidyltransferase domain-containing protein [Candidatus Caccosoma sp.]|nr:nucleotidyltransferase domain-containing protein [Candidatus Caccosoma sp.]